MDHVPGYNVARIEGFGESTKNFAFQPLSAEINSDLASNPKRKTCEREHAVCGDT